MSRGFTLVEILVASAILAAALGIIAGIYVSGLKVWDDARTMADLQAQARLAMNFMTAELRNATRISDQNPSPELDIPSSPNNKHISFYLPEDRNNDGLITDANGAIEWGRQVIQYQYIPGLRQLRRLENGAHRVLAEDVSDVQFIDADIDGSLPISEVRIILTLAKTTVKGRNLTFTLTSNVRLKN